MRPTNRRLRRSSFRPLLPTVPGSVMASRANPSSTPQAAAMKFKCYPHPFSTPYPVSANVGAFRTPQQRHHILIPQITAFPVKRWSPASRFAPATSMPAARANSVPTVFHLFQCRIHRAEQPLRDLARKLRQYRHPIVSATQPVPDENVVSPPYRLARRFFLLQNDTRHIGFILHPAGDH